MRPRNIRASFSSRGRIRLPSRSIRRNLTSPSMPIIRITAIASSPFKRIRLNSSIHCATTQRRSCAPKATALTAPSCAVPISVTRSTRSRMDAFAHSPSPPARSSASSTSSIGKRGENSTARQPQNQFAAFSASAGSKGEADSAGRDPRRYPQYRCCLCLSMLVTLIFTYILNLTRRKRLRKTGAVFTFLSFEKGGGRADFVQNSGQPNSREGSNSDRCRKGENYD